MTSSNFLTDWSLCFLCQNETKEQLRKPREIKTLEHSSYRTLAKNIPLFYQLRALPIPLNLQRLDNGKGIEQTLIDNDAKYHETCRLLFKDSKLERVKQRTEAEKQKSSLDLLEQYSSPKMKRKSTDMGHLMCFICDKDDIKANLSQVETLKTCHTIKDMATELNDSKLLKSVCVTDPIAQELKYHPRCLTSIHNRVRALKNLRQLEECEENLEQGDSFPLALSELVAYQCEQRRSESSEHTTDLLN